ncbi:MAG: hypothetical protein V4439_03310 [Patescibacteria group bacterium]
MQKIQEKIKKVFESKVLVKVLQVVGIVIVALLIFSAGVVTGFHKASYRHAWGEHYYDNFGKMGRRDGMRGMMGGAMGEMMENYPNAHGAIGKIIKIQLPTLIIADKDNTEKVVLIKDDTKIINGRDEIKKEDLKVDDFVIVIGTPNAEGQVESKFIRIMPVPDFLNQNQTSTISPTTSINTNANKTN